MAEEYVDVRIEDRDDIIRIIGESHSGIEHELRDAVDDIADKIEEYAKILAPEGETEELKEHPVDVVKTRGTVGGGNPLFGGGFAIQGPTGFIKGVGIIPGRLVEHIEITVAREPEYAIWVHTGTGIFGPHGTPIVPVFAKNLVFEIDGRKFRLPSVRGQQAQPYLTDAYEYVHRTFVDRRVAELKLEAETFFK